MKIRHLIMLWLFITAFLVVEYLSLHRYLKTPSLLSLLLTGKSRGLSPKAGEQLSYALGWIGFGIICLTNLYIVRKRLGLFPEQGKMSRWLDFHIFCGLMGPTFIVFHSNFRVYGLVAVSFWSMVISVVSGIIGRYFYVQILMQRSGIKAVLSRFDRKCESYIKGQRVSREVLQELRSEAIAVAGANFNPQASTSVLEVFRASLFGDVRIFLHRFSQEESLPTSLVSGLKKFALYQRRLVTLDYFKSLMGYWHSFHLPFAIFMYVVAILHIIAALVFRVGG